MAYRAARRRGGSWLADGAHLAEHQQRLVKALREPDDVKMRQHRANRPDEAGAEERGVAGVSGGAPQPPKAVAERTARALKKEARVPSSRRERLVAMHACSSRRVCVRVSLGWDGHLAPSAVGRLSLHHKGQAPAKELARLRVARRVPQAERQVVGRAPIEP